MKKITTLFLAITMFFVMSISSVVASPVNQSNNQWDYGYAKDILISYLDASIRQDVDAMLSYVKDGRFSCTIIQREKYILSLQELHLVEYEITGMYQESQTVINFETFLTFDNERIEKVPFVLRKYNNSWKVVIGEHKLEVIEEGVEQSGIAPRSRTLATWNFWNRASMSSFLSIDTFNISGSQATLRITSQLYSGGGPGGMTYQIVRTGFFGDTVWGQRQVNGTVSRSTDFLITGSGSLNGAQIRFIPQHNTFTGTLRYEGQGSLIQ